ncbi:esterase-like activity of phytase family protein [Pannonibacter phragmitetus]|uniref:esterase-like activity of phytase family protein n=1 Tax=Pannonibacter phragmitetus TaxID=121719 RepID=UPI000F019596|nr:esterase-like activity of phytase family protein [Pannonibacter phragmitetus]
MISLRSQLLAGFSVLAAVSQASAADTYFTRIATMPVYKTLGEGVDPATQTSAEIIAVTKDGQTLVFSDSPGEAVVFVDIANPAEPKPAGRIAMGGEPTSVTAAQKFILAGVNTSPNYTEPSGHLAVISLAEQSIAATCDVKGQPDSVAISPDGKFLAVAVENERDEELNEGKLPQMPAGHVAIFDLDADGMPVNCEAARIVDVTGLAEIAPEDPEPEFVSINEDNVAVLTLQENNHLALIDLASGTVTAHFSAGTASAEAVPVAKGASSDASGNTENVKREPDAVAWLDNDRFITANEGDYEGGSRGFTIWNTKGEVLYDSGNKLEHIAMMTGHYPAKRASKKGTEPEGVAIGEFGGQKLIFVNSERANMVSVFKDTGGEPQLLQMLPTHVAPEGVLAIPSRNLFVVANEADKPKDGLRSQVGIYEFGADKPAYPVLTSAIDPETGAPIGWGALSGLAADKTDPNKLYAVSDSFYDKARIYTLNLSMSPVEITSYVNITGGSPKKFDMEGISLAKDGGFWLVSEGNPEKEGVPHLLVKADANGKVTEEISLPEALVAQSKRFGFEGVAEFERGGKTLVVTAIQREWGDDAKGLVKLGIYNPADKSWGFVHYPLDAPKSSAGGWVGLSEITHLGGERFAVLERDNQGGELAAIKQITVIDLAGIEPVALGGTLPVVEKTVKLDLIPALASSKGWLLDKPEGFTVTADGRMILVTDNDGVDDAPGETQIFTLGSVDKLN